MPITGLFNKFTFSLALVAALHLGLLFTQANQKKITVEERTPLKIKNIRTLGEETSKLNSFYLSDSEPSLKEDSFDLSDLNITPNETPTKAIENLGLKNKEIKEFVQASPSSSPNPVATNRYQNSSRYKTSDVSANVELPKGVELDDLNSEELMFYSFQKRSAIQYITTFYDHLQTFERRNPHLKFPLTNDRTRMTGRITYDKDGNIVRIQVLEWTKTQRLQDFFVSVLEDMKTLPNPPQMLLNENDEFSVVYSLLINI